MVTTLETTEVLNTTYIKLYKTLEADTVLFPQAIAIIESMPALGDVGAYEKAVRHLEQLTPIALETYLGE